MKVLKDALLTTLFPTACHVCGQLVESNDYGVACQQCWQAYQVLPTNNLCLKCGYPFEIPSQNFPIKDCLRCRNILFSLARACGAYEGAMSASILALKTRPYLCEKLVELIQNTVQKSDFLPINLVIPIPLHLNRLKERGFNQALLIAEYASKFITVDLDNESLARVKPTIKHRVGMNVVDREDSLKGAFQVTRPRLVKGQIVLLVDDVFTTGTTISVATKALLEAGAKEVKVFTLARVI
ncbi:MAG: ComF family protein [Blastocatellia bacterium]|nr:ComF family protein [Blastocatellia bacterium]MBL8193163.1 ComF family protein [Blastocatellia bacterium]MBN8722296.1 ComF family protein [Acidobacteriota bacterium]